jgi:uncharacterized protein YidB (DUF937 family)
MARGFPSMTALLALLAVAGYQNRDKIAEMLKGNQSGATVPGRTDSAGGLGGILNDLGGKGGVGGVGGILGGALAELLERFKQTGNGDVADSWIKTGPNKDIAPNQLETAIGPDVLDALSEQTGLSREEILRRLSQELPTAVDRYTPAGRLPTQDELARA